MPVGTADLNRFGDDNRLVATTAPSLPVMTHAAPEQPHPGEGLVRIGAIVFALGLVDALLVLVPFFLGRTDAPLPLALGTVLMPIGLGIALSGLLRAARQGRRSATRSGRARHSRW
ncbi:MAG: hypothetical protein NVSMB55_03030 [Mycobacteriales bacterium]